MARLVSPSKKARIVGHGESPSQVLLQPTEDRPWLVEVESAFPLKLQEALSKSSHPNAAARCGRWMALVSPANSSSSKIHKLGGGYVVHVWRTPSLHEFSAHEFSAQKTNKAVITLQHPKWTGLKQHPPLIALAPSSAGIAADTADSVYLYVANPEDGTLSFYRLNATDLHKSLPPTPKSYVKLLLESKDDVGDDNDDDDDNASYSSKERISCLQAAPHHLVLVGTTKNRAIWVQQSQTVLTQFPVPSLDQHGAASAAPSFLTRMFWGSTSHSKQQQQQEEAEMVPHDSYSLTKTLFLSRDTEKDLFVTIAKGGHVVFWQAQRSDTMLAPDFTQRGSLWLRSALDKALFSSSSNNNNNKKLLSVEVLQATSGSSNGNRNPNIMVHVLIRASFSSSDDVAMEDNPMAQDEARLFWLRLEEQMVLPETQQGSSSTGHQPQLEWALTSAVWLDRFHEPERVQVAGMMVSGKGVAYAALTRQKGGPNQPTIPIVMAHDVQEGPDPHLYELDLIDVAMDSLLLGLFEDERSFGCTLAISTGMLVRVECKEATEAASREPSSYATTSRQKVPSLLTHLRGNFWESYLVPDRRIVVPPSIQNAERGDLDLVIVRLCQEVQASYSMEHHLGLLNFLSVAGIYRSVMLLTKWHLMAIGQELAAFEAIPTTPSVHLEKFMGTLTSVDVAKWLESVQLAIWQEGSVVAFEDFSAVLERALRAAADFRAERCQLTYDISTGTKLPKAKEPSLVPLWTSKPVLQKVLQKQISYWNEPKTKIASNEVLEVVVQSALQSFGNAYSACPSESTRIAYSRMQAQAISLLRKINGKERDELAWSLSKEHGYFGGCCQISYDHRKENGEYSLVPLFKKFSEKEDVSTGLSFAKFVIKWFLDRNLIGEALKLGENCQDDLLMMMNSEKSLKPYRWIVSLKRGDYDSATRNLAVGEGAEVTLAQAKFNLAVAKLSNKVLLQKSVNRRVACMERAKDIENKREIAHCQAKLFPSDDAQNSSLWKAESLLGMALDKIEHLKDSESKLETGTIALALCAAMDDSGEQSKNAATDVWYKLIKMEWSKVEKTLVADKKLATSVLQDTIFGKLHASLGGLDGVSLNAVLPRLISEHFQHSPDEIPLQRVLRSFLDASHN